MADNIGLIGRGAAGGLASLLVWGAAPPAAAQCEMAKLLANDGAANDQFGVSVAISGGVAVVGARWDDENGRDSGAAFVFRWTGSAWVQEAKLLPSDGAAFDLFGRSVSISGDVAVVGAPLDDDDGIDSGSAYLFQKPPGGWVDMTQTAKLTASDGAADDFFAVPVSISGDVVVVGAYADDDNGSFSGSAYVFQKPPGGWVDMTQTAKLTASDGAVDDFFALSVSISGEVIVVGANGDDDNGSRSGSAYVFVKPPGGWVNLTETAKLTASDGAANDKFGWYVSTRGDVIVIGANSDTDNGTNSGSAYVFQEPPGGWVDMTQTAKLTASDGAANDVFGESVSISGDVIVVGAPGDDDNFSLSGSAYVFVKPPGGWVNLTETAKLTASDAAVDDLFGFSVSISGDVAVVGAYLHDDNGSASGSAYVSGVPGLDCNSTGQPDACDIFAGTSPDLNANLIPDDCEFSSRLYSLTGPGDGIGWSWCVSAPNLGTVCNLNVTGVAGTTLDVAQHFADSINADPLPDNQLFAAAIEDLGTTYLQVRVNFLTQPVLCVGRVGGPADCCPTFRINDCSFNPTMQEEPISPLDCNGNGQSDTIDIIFGVSLDLNNNGIPDECDPPSSADISGPLGAGFPDGCVDAFDLGAMLGAWCSALNDPNPPSPPCENCIPANLAVADISGAANVADGCVDAFDLAKLLAAWCSVAGGNPCGTCFPPP